MASDDDSKKVRSEIIFTIIAGMIGLVALIGLIYVLCLLRHRYNQHLLRQAQQQQGMTTNRPPPRVKPRLSSHRQHLASSRRQQQQPPQPDDTYSIDSASTMIELQQRFHNSVNSNSSYMADLFSITSDMLMQQSSPTSSTLSPPPSQQPVSKFSGMDPMAHHHQQLPKRPPPHSSSEAYFATNFANLPTSASSKIILNHQNDNSTAGDDNDDDFDEVWSYVATDVDIGLLNDGSNCDDIQSIVTYDGHVIRDNVGTATLPDSHLEIADSDEISSPIGHTSEFVGRSAKSARNLFEV